MEGGGREEDMGCSQKRCTKGGDRVRGCITHLLSIKIRMLMVFICQL